MDLPRNLIDEAAVKTALDEELEVPRKLLPPSAVLPALQAHREDVTAWAYAQVSGSFTPSLQEVVAVSKARRGIRPVAVWDLPSWLLYGALSKGLSSALSTPSRTHGAWEEFERSPLNSSGKYIVAADIASCYQLIDHSLLSQELLVQTGEGETVSAIMTLLRESSGQTYGLPQQSKASDLMAEAFLGLLERALTRRGLTVGRYNDDFRVNCGSWSDVVRSIEILSEEARKLGLMLNDSKVLTWSRDKYRAQLDEAEQLRKEIADDAGIDLEAMDSDDYFGSSTIQEPELEQADLLTESRVLKRWSDTAGSGRIPEEKRGEYRALLKLLPIALNSLGSSPNDADDILGTTMQLLRYEQTLTPRVCSYLLTHNNSEAVISAFDRLLEDNVYLTGWQTWWLQQPLARLQRFAEGRGATKRLEWLRDAFSSAERSPLLHAHAAMTLARHHETDPNQLLSVYDRSSPVVRPVVVAAIGLLKPNAKIRQAVTGDSKLNKWIFDWATQNA